MNKTQPLCRKDAWTGVDPEDTDAQPRAVRWATRMLERMFQPDWTKWHYTEGNGLHTACDHPVQLMLVDGSPQVAGVSKINCKRCLAAMAGSNKQGGQS